VALVIGNGDYEGDRRNAPVEDARAFAATLRKLDFDVTVKEDADYATMLRLIGEFRRKLQSADEAVFFYGGHGAQIDDQNYMLPVKSGVLTRKTFGSLTVPVSEVYEALRVGTSRFNLVILDTCRDNPFVADAGGDRLVINVPEGLIEPKDVEVPIGTIIAYSTRPGTKAEDKGTGVHSPYSEALLEYMNEPGMTIHEFFMRVRNKVQDITTKAQTSWESTSQTVDFSFRAPVELELTILDGDDEVFVTMNGQALLWGADQRTPRVLRLRGGDNIVRVFVHNDKTTRGLLGAPEGWRFDVRMRIVLPDGNVAAGEIRRMCDPAANPPSSILELMAPPAGIHLCGGENEPREEHWGATFLAAAARIHLDAKAGRVTFRVVENEVWRDGFSVADNSMRDELEQSLAWTVWHENLPLYGPGLTNRKSADEIRNSALNIHKELGGGSEAGPAGSSRAAHAAARKRIERATAEELEEALLRLRHWEVDRDAHSLAANLAWAVRERSGIMGALQQGDFNAVRKMYREVQDHNPNTRNLLNVVSNADLERLRKQISSQ
jgi:hypothetical protein